ALADGVARHRPARRRRGGRAPGRRRPSRRPDAALAVRLGRPARIARDPLLWTALAFVALVLLMPALKPLFAALFPWLDRPLYEQASFLDLVAAHLALVGGSSGVAVAVGVAAGIFVTRPAGAEFRGLVETVVAIGQTFPPVAVLALAVPA